MAASEGRIDDHRDRWELSLHRLDVRIPGGDPGPDPNGSPVRPILDLPGEVTPPRTWRRVRGRGPGAAARRTPSGPPGARTVARGIAVAVAAERGRTVVMTDANGPLVVVRGRVGVT